MASVSIRLPGGKRVKAVKFGLAGTTYWLLPQDARIAQDWDRQRPVDEDITRAAFIQKNAVRTDGPPKTAKPPTPAFAVGDVVTLTCGGTAFTVEKCDEAGVHIIATDYGPGFRREVLDPRLLMLRPPARTCADLEAIPF